MNNSRYMPLAGFVPWRCLSCTLGIELPFTNAQESQVILYKRLRSTFTQVCKHSIRNTLNGTAICFSGIPNNPIPNGWDNISIKRQAFTRYNFKDDFSKYSKLSKLYMHWVHQVMSKYMDTGALK